MALADSKYWNLAQVAAWVMYREMELVVQFEHPSRTGFMALGMYPSLEPSGRQKIASSNDLNRTLEDGRLTAWGYRANSNQLEQIPSREWTDLTLAPPFAYDTRNLAAKHQPWTDIRLESAAVKKLWRSEHEISGRTKFDWDAVRPIHDELLERNPDFSQNDLITEIQGAFHDHFNKEPPSRSSIQRHLKSWK